MEGFSPLHDCGTQALGVNFVARVDFDDEFDNAKEGWKWVGMWFFPRASIPGCSMAPTAPKACLEIELSIIPRLGLQACALLLIAVHPESS